MDEQNLQLLNQAKSLSYSGFSKEEIFQKLNATNLTPEMRKYVLGVIDDAQVDLEMKKQVKEAGLNKMVFGAFVFLFGLIISYVYYTANSVAVYIVFGMILGGPYLIYIGYKQYANPISDEIKVRKERIVKSKFKKF
jgi:hypothetical protein